MSHKFLPFVTETSTPEFIFKSIVQRSKGYKSKSLSAIYSAILVVGIKKVKEYVNSLPINLSSNEVMDKIASNYAEFAVPNSEIQFWVNVCKLYDIELLKLSTDYGYQELSVMMASMAKHSPHYLETINFNWDVEKLNTFSNTDFDCLVTELPNTEFSAEGERLGFTNFTELKVFVCAAECKATQNKPILPIFIEITGEENIPELYTKHNCIGPFNKESEQEEEEEDDIPF